MANIDDKTNLTNHGNLTKDNELNWISQINVGDTIYDIATHHGITFKDGSNGSPVVWNGLTDLEIVIPSIADIVQTPIEFAGTVGENGAISWNDAHKDGPQTGYLVFFSADCEFTDEKIACEAGDMAIYDGSKWNVVSGENEVMLVAPMDQEGGNVATVAVGSSKNVLTVAGKTLALTLDYNELNKHLDKSTGSDEVVDLSNVKVASKRIALSQATAVSKNIGEQKTLTLATELKDGTVTFTGAENLINSVNFGKLDPGKFPVYNKNTADIKLNVSDGGLALNKTEGDDFVTGITLGNISIASATSSDNNAFNMVTGVISKEGNGTFVNGIITTNVSSEATFTLKGYYIPENTTYVTGLGTGNDIVTNINAGSFELVDDGTDLLATGFGSEADSGDVVSSVLVTTGTTDVFSGAKVEGNVLSFSTSPVHSGNVTTTAKYKTLNKTGFKYTSATADKGGFTTAEFTKDDDVMYKVTTGKEKLWETTTQSVKIETPTVTPTKGKYVINHDEMKATVPADTFYIGMTDGTLPSLSEGSTTPATLGGSVKKELATTTENINVLSANSIDMPGVYSIVDVQTGGVEVGKAGALNDVETAIVDLKGYLTGVTIIEKAKA